MKLFLRQSHRVPPPPEPYGVAHVKAMAVEQDGVSKFALFPNTEEGSLAMLIFLCSSAILIALFVEVVSDGERFLRRGGGQRC